MANGPQSASFIGMKMAANGLKMAAKTCFEKCQKTNDLTYCASFK